MGCCIKETDCWLDGSANSMTTQPSELFMLIVFGAIGCRAS